MSQDLETLRARLRALDDKLTQLVAERHVLSLLVAEAKVERGLPVRHPQIEEETIKRCQAAGRQLGVPEQTMEKVMRALIESSVQVQESHLKDLSDAKRSAQGN